MEWISVSTTMRHRGTKKIKQKNGGGSKMNREGERGRITEKKEEEQRRETNREEAREEVRGRERRERRREE